MGDFQYCTKVNKLRLNKVTDFDRLGIRVPQSTTCMLRICEMGVCMPGQNTETQAVSSRGLHCTGSREKILSVICRI